MRVYYSNLCRLGSGLSESIDEMIRYGAGAIELMMDGPQWDEFETRGRELAALLSEKPVVYSIHTPVWDINLTSENAQARQAALEAYRHSIAFAASIHAAHVVVHPGFCYAPVFDKKTARERAARAVGALCRFNSLYGVPLLVENVGSAATCIFTQDEYIAFIGRFGGRIGSLLDIGHANLCGWNLTDTISRLKPFLYAVHLHDNNGTADSHLPIGSGSIQWGSVFQELLECRPDLRLILEYDIGTPLELLRGGKELLTQAFAGKIGLGGEPSPDHSVSAAVQI
jgi:sugar phosphate isomerase/epimerase